MPRKSTPPTWESLTEQAHAQRKKLMPKGVKYEKAPQPKGFDFEAYWADAEAGCMIRISAAMKERKTSMGGISFTPIGIGTDAFVAKLNAVLPAPFRAVNSDTHGWDATEMYDITWAPERA